MKTDKKFDYFVKKRALEKEITDAERVLEDKKRALEELQQNESNSFFREAQQAYLGQNLIVSGGMGSVLLLYKIKKIVSANDYETKVVATTVLREDTMLIGNTSVDFIVNPGETPIKEGDSVTVVSDETFYNKVKYITDSIARHFVPVTDDAQMVGSDI